MNRRPPKTLTQHALDATVKRLAQAAATRAFARKAPLIGALMASEDVIKKLAHAGHDLLAGHPAGARNELQQAITHAIGAGANVLGGVSVVGITAGLVGQVLARQHAQTLAAAKPLAPLEDRTLYGKLADQADHGLRLARSVLALRAGWQAMGEVVKASTEAGFEPNQANKLANSKANNKANNKASIKSGKKIRPAK